MGRRVLLKSWRFDSVWFFFSPPFIFSLHPLRFVLGQQKSWLSFHLFCLSIIILFFFIDIFYFEIFLDLFFNFIHFHLIFFYFYIKYNTHSLDHCFFYPFLCFFFFQFYPSIFYLFFFPDWVIILIVLFIIIIFLILFSFN
jgi:hypothetical protein